MNNLSTVTFIKSGQISIARACTEACRYCSWRSTEKRAVTDIIEVNKHLRDLNEAGASEVLFISGHSPDDFPEAQLSLRKNSCTSFLEYLQKICLSALEMNLLPVLEVSSLDSWEMKELNGFAAGLSINLVSAVLDEASQAHEFSKNRNPENGKRLIEQAHNAELPYRISFLVGIGETADERKKFIKEIGKFCAADPFLQDVRLVPFQPLSGTDFRARPPLQYVDIAETVLLLQEFFPVHYISVPVNLFSRYSDLVSYGLNDLGSYPVLLNDVVMPSFVFPDIEQTKNTFLKKDIFLAERQPLTTPIAVNRPHISRVFQNRLQEKINRKSSASGFSDNDGCFLCGKRNQFGLKLDFQFPEDGVCVSNWLPRPEFQGYAGIVHGGILAALLDEIMAQALIKQGRNYVTVELKTIYRKPAQIGHPLRIVGRVEPGKHRIRITKGEIVDTNGVLLAEAEAKYAAVASVEE
ncbi:MAG: hotdog fold thioesterase [Candidatus Riflebacteria bacterium]|nr:hotdog fold thioesterase [Candidatus Riflebacteria bacterium]